MKTLYSSFTSSNFFTLPFFCFFANKCFCRNTWENLQDIELVFYNCKELSFLKQPLANCDCPVRSRCASTIVVLNLLRQSKSLGWRTLNAPFLQWENSRAIYVLALSSYLGTESIFRIKRMSSQSQAQSISVSPGRSSRLRTLPLTFTACVNLTFTIAVNLPRSSEYLGNLSRL